MIYFRGVTDINSPSHEHIRHSFRLSFNYGKNNANKYLKDVFRSNVSFQDLIDFEKGTYYDAGIINAYLRILDTYFEYDLAK